MAKQKRRKVRRPAAGKPENEVASREATKPVSDDGRPDFGGITDRDLKKNLGCG